MGGLAEGRRPSRRGGRCLHGFPAAPSVPPPTLLVPFCVPPFAPQILLQAGFDTPTDIWSLGCLVWELVTGQYLFHPRTVGTRGRDRDHLLQASCRGGQPALLAPRCTRARLSDGLRF